MAILLNFCIEVFTNAAEDIAVRVHAMQILFNIARKEPDFAGELIELIEHEMEYHGSAGISSRGRKLLKRLHEIMAHKISKKRTFGYT
jgi:predicted nucleic acid-binding OB-fold protein